VSAPNFQITISGSVVAAYAAIVSTLTGAVQLLNFRRDRARIRLSVQRNMMIIGDPRYADKKLTLLTVVNSGRRPVTISSVGARCLHPHDSFVIVDTNPSLPHELTEGKNLNARMPTSGLDFSKIDFWEAWDAVGRSYRMREAPWLKHILSSVRWRREWRRSIVKN
jgi:hypothetical protein